MNTDTWTTSPDHPGYKIKTIKKGNCTIQVLRPELDAKEQKKREARVQTVAERVMRDYYKRKENNDEPTHSNNRTVRS